jgi:hypothetical protein
MSSTVRTSLAPLGVLLLAFAVLASSSTAQTAAPAKPADASAPAATSTAPADAKKSDTAAPAPGGRGRGRGRQVLLGPGGPTPRLGDGHPDFTGLWSPVREQGKPGGNIGKDLPDHKLPFTPAGEAALQYNLTKTIDPEALCILGGIPRHDASGLSFQVISHPKKVIFLYVYNTHRVIPVDPNLKHDEDPDPKYFGNAISHWEGDTLVADIVGFKDSKDGKLWIDENGNPQSAATHVTERWSRPDLNHIHLELTVDDPVYYQHPFNFSRTWQLGGGMFGGSGDGDLAEYACNENNVDAKFIGPGPGPIGPDGNRGAGYGKLPDVPPSPEFYEKAAAATPK